MIQRIQSLWLLLAVVALIAVLFLPIGTFVMPNGLYECTAFKMTQVGSLSKLGLPIAIIGIISSLSALFSLVSIFVFKKRSSQIRLVWVAFTLKMVLAASMIGLFLYFKYALNAKVEYGCAVYMPVVGLIMDYLGIIGIRKDEALIKSLDRIR